MTRSGVLTVRPGRDRGGRENRYRLSHSPPGPVRDLATPGTAVPAAYATVPGASFERRQVVGRIRELTEAYGRSGVVRVFDVRGF
ncbi:hypothetical protein GCM10018772_55180 [Streptomyces fumanus]|uniref:Uncharacterized protein n=1 Tax=Streptomyces fumanus TaxID=67302 RepID=A0A919ASZ7_9ACTN|nr:hypothetical protein GCM10018772_55180 [Streptomyces fumanus]